MAYPVALITILVFLAASYGWGYAAMKLVACCEASYVSFLSAVGVACWIFFGGILNLAGIAYPAMLFVLLLSGLIFSLAAFFSWFKKLPSLLRPVISGNLIGGVRLAEIILPLSVVITAAIYSAINFIPAGVFNSADDFHTYIPRPLRMLQTGTLAGNPFDILGLDSLGAQAFLQSFFLRSLPLEYLPSFDAVFCFVMTGLILAALAHKFKLSWVYATLPILVFIIINPQSVNVSALYSGTFIILGLFFISCLLIDQINEPSTEKLLRLAALLGLFFSSLVALKITFSIFAALYFILFIGCLFILATHKRRVFEVCGMSTLTATVTLIPWLALYWRNYAAAIQTVLQPTIMAEAGEFSLTRGGVGALFSTHDLFFGSSLLAYGSIIFVLAILGTLAIYFVFKKGKINDVQRGYSLVSAAASAAAIANYFLVGGLFFDPDTAVRYASPVLIAALPFALLMAAGNRAKIDFSPPRQLYTLSCKLSVLVGSCLVILLFWDSFIVRVERAHYKHSTVSYPIDYGDILYSRNAFSPEAKQSIRSIQNLTAENKKILAWLSLPMHLDFSRNEILFVMSPGLANPWMEMPLNGNAVDMMRYLKKQGVRYIMWEYEGAGVEDVTSMQSSPLPLYRKIAARALYFRKMLNLLMEGGIVLYHQNGVVLLDLDQIN